MLSGIFGKKSDHPLADMQSAQALLEDLPKNDAIKLVMELTEWIESVSDNADFKVDHQFAVLRLLDEFVQPYARKLVREYFVTHELNKFQENRLWLVSCNLYRHTAQAYYTVFSRYCNTEKGSNAIRAQVPLLMARAVYAMVGHLKYVCVRYGPIDKTFWANLAQIYKYAEQQQYLDTPVNLYPGAVGNTSVRCEAGHLLGWYGSGVHALSPPHMHLTERIVAQYCLTIDMYAQLSKDSLFSFDLDCPTAPVRVKVDATARASTRFVSMIAMQPKLESLLKILDKNLVPEDLNLNGNYEAALVKDAVQYLLNYFVSPPLRRSERRRIVADFDVVTGFVGVVECTDAGLNFNKEKPARWAIEDISAGGFGTVLPAQTKDDVRIGSLLGMRLDDVPHWSVAVVRRLTRNDANQLHMGAEILSNQVTSVALSQSGGAGAGFEDGRLALWLYEKQGESSGEAQLLMETDTFSAQRSFHTQLNGKKYLLMPVGVQERYIDCDLVRFRIVEQEGSAEEFY